MKEKELKKELDKRVKKAKKKEELYHIPWDIFRENTKKVTAKNLNILLLNTPCEGFGDLIFAHKLGNYIREWYKSTVLIATPNSDKIKILGEKDKNVIKLNHRDKSEYDSDDYCLQFKHFKMKKNVPIFDLILVAPQTLDWNLSPRDVKTLIPYSNKFNTFFFSEYNDSLYRTDFDTGVGDRKEGIFLTKTPKLLKRPSNIGKKYWLVYISIEFPNHFKCFISFVEMISAKNKEKRCEIIVPKWISDEILEDYDDYTIPVEKRVLDKLYKYYGKIIVKMKNKERIYEKDNNKKNTLILRGDIFPVPNKEMLRLMKYSQKDILLSGDQSITDVLSCCPEKNIFYQIGPHKENLGKALAENLPNKFLLHKKTSCGTLEGIHYKSKDNHSNFIKENDFRKKGKEKLDSLILATKTLKTSPVLERFENMVLSSTTLKNFKNKYLD